MVEAFIQSPEGGDQQVRRSGGAPTRRPRKCPRGFGGHVLVVQTSFLGDVVLTTPLLSALNRILEPRRLTVVVRPEALPLVDGHPCVDSVIVDDKRGVDSGLRGCVRAARRIRAVGADVAVVPHGSLRTAVVLALAGVPWRVGFRDGTGSVLYHARVMRDRSLHAVERNLALLGAFGEEPESYAEPPRLAVSAGAAERAERVLDRLGVGTSAPLYGLCPGSVWPTKRWSAAEFGTVARELDGQDGARVLLLGAPEDAAVGEEVRCHGGARAINLIGQTDLGTFVALVARLRVLVCNDSAPMHIAAALGVPVVAVFCATTPAQGFGPYGAPAVVLGADLECRPCGRHGGLRCPIGTGDCMRLVAAVEVLAAVKDLLSRRSRERSAPSSLMCQ